MALFDCQLAMMANVGSAFLASGNEPRRFGNGHPTVVPYQVFDSSDGRVVIAVGNDRQFAVLCRGLLERPEDRKRVVSGKSVSVRVDLGGRRIIKKKKIITIQIMS